MITFYIVGSILLIFLWYVLTPRKKNEEGFKLWNFNADSWHARYYKWVVVGDLPQGGCVYFWSIIGLVAFSPLILTASGLYHGVDWVKSLAPKRKKKKKAEEKTPEEWQEYLERKNERDEVIRRRMEKLAGILGKVTLGVIALGMLFGIYRLFFIKTQQWLTILQAIGLIVLVLSISVGIVWTFKKFRVGLLILKAIKPLGYPFKYLWSMVVAIYTKSCPKITWNYGEQLPAEAETKNVDEQSVL